MASNFFGTGEVLLYFPQFLPGIYLAGATSHPLQRWIPTPGLPLATSFLFQVVPVLSGFGDLGLPDFISSVP